MSIPTVADNGICAPVSEALRFATRMPEHLLRESAWSELIPLSFLIVALARPRTIVELGVHHGASYCSFCEAAVALSLDASCCGIDTWAGDQHAGFYDGNDVLERLRALHDPLYGSFSCLLKSTFDDALTRFEDGSIDLLHIDGLHLYEAVAHDFSAWLPKLSSRSVVLLHDIAEFHDDFGVFRLWEEIKAAHPTFQVSFGHGLGIAAVGRELPAGINALLSLAEPAKATLRSVLEGLGQRIALTIEVGRIAGEEQKLRHRAAMSAAERDQLAAERDQLAAERDQLAAERDRLTAEHARLCRELADSNDRLQDARQRCLDVQQRFESVTTSLSWRCTGPIRRALDRLRAFAPRR